MNTRANTIITGHEGVTALNEIIDWAELVSDDIRRKLNEFWHTEQQTENLKETQEIIAACKKRIAEINWLTN
jgi:hypothetical protein